MTGVGRRKDRGLRSSLLIRGRGLGCIALRGVEARYWRFFVSLRHLGFRRHHRRGGFRAGNLLDSVAGPGAPLRVVVAEGRWPDRAMSRASRHFATIVATRSMAAPPVGATSAVAPSAVSVARARAGTRGAAVARSHDRGRIARGRDRGDHLARRAWAAAHGERQADDMDQGFDRPRPFAGRVHWNMRRHVWFDRRRQSQRNRNVRCKRYRPGRGEIFG